MSAPQNLSAAAGKGKKIVLTWSSSSDDVGVSGYYVFRDGKQVGTTSATSFTDTLSGRSTSAKYYVVAFDAAGNQSPPSTTLLYSG